MGFKNQADQISHALPMTCHHCNLDVWALVQRVGHLSLVTPERVLSKYNKDLIIFCDYVWYKLVEFVELHFFHKNQKILN